jgi:acetate kinase
MGFTPLEGLMMGRRSGSVDPGLLLHLLGRRGLNLEALDAGLNEQAGLFGVSGVSADMRAVLAAVDNDNERARLALDMFVHRLISTIGGMVAVLGGLDALVFTGGIGEHSPSIRAAVAARLAYIGLALDEGAHQRAQADADLTGAASTARVLVVAAREELTILSEVKRLLPGDSPPAPLPAAPTR